MPDPSYKNKPPRPQGRQDGPGSENFGATTREARKSKDVVSLGGVTSTNTNLTKLPSNLGRKNTKLKYPLHNSEFTPAKLKFTAYSINAYSVDPKGLADLLDVPLLGWGDNKARTIKEASKEAAATRATREENTRGLNDYGDGDAPENVSTTATVGGRQDGPGSVTEGNQVKDKNNEASQDALKGANIADSTTLDVKIAEGVPSIELYFPQNFGMTDDVDYSQVDLGPAGLAATATINKRGSLINAVSRGITDGMESIFNLATGALSGDAAQVAAARATQFIPKEGIRAAVTGATQTGINPGTRILFNKPIIRPFTFTFKLIATSIAEAEQIHKIVKTLRSEMYPETINLVGGVPAGYKFPNVFKIDFDMKGADIKIPAIQYCYLKSVQAVYNSTSMTFHPDGHPTEVDLTLLFQEYKALSKQDVEEGY
jgi:hypothetical protein